MLQNQHPIKNFKALVTSVKRKCKEPRSYPVETDGGKILRQNRCHILRAPRKDPPEASESASDQEFESIN